MDIQFYKGEQLKILIKFKISKDNVYIPIIQFTKIFYTISYILTYILKGQILFV